MERPHGLQLSADQDVRESHADPAPDAGLARVHRAAAGAGGGCGLVGVSVPHTGRFCPAGGRAGPRCGALRGLLVAQGVVDGAADLRRRGGPGGRAGGGRAHWSAHTVCARRLRLCRHHRGLCGAAAPGGHDFVGHPHEHVLHRRRAGAVAHGPAQVAHGRVPGPAAVYAAGLLLLDRLPHPLGGREGRQVMESYALLIGATLSAGTVLAIAALGLLINEKAGIVNLGAEGMTAGALLATIFGVLVIWLNTNQYATGLALSLFGVGFSAFAGISYVQAKLPELPKYVIPVLGDVPLLGPALFRQHPLVYLTMLLVAGLIWFLYRTRAGLVLRSVGESPESAHALGYPVRRIRLAAVVAGGSLCGLAGAYISTVYTPLWVEGMVAGRGWIALALTTFATWRPARVLLGAYLFGGVTMLQFHLQATGVQVASQLLSMLPYVATIVVLALISRNPAWIRINMPASLGKPFYPGS